ncbi:MAG: AAA family ATPase [Streptosporangiales bacterium]|nr:AAA family ATPase [Streptosporangiales bacterium]
MESFIGRERELSLLTAILERAQRGGLGGRPGRAMLIRGRRRVGKSRLVEEFVERADVPCVFFTAEGQATAAADVELFVQAIAESSLPGARRVAGLQADNWPAAFRLLTAAIGSEEPAVVVMDEMPYLVRNDPGFEGALQKAFDRDLARLPVLLLGIGSDISMMEALNAYGRPFHQRATEMVVSALTPRDVADALSLPAAQAFDAYLVSGGLPLILDEWPEGATVAEYLRSAVRDPTSALLVSGERSIAAEFPDEAQARQVLRAVGTGEQTFTGLMKAAGLPKTTLLRALRLLADKRMVTTALPLSTKASQQARYLITDAHLRFWLAFLGRYMAEIERGRGDLTLARIEKTWTTWRGQAVEPIIREAVSRLVGDQAPMAEVVGSYWTRAEDVQIDLVGADREPVAREIHFVGSIKWRDNRPFSQADLAELHVQRSQLPGASASTPLVAVSRAAAQLDGVYMLTAEDLLDAWRVR